MDIERAAEWRVTGLLVRPSANYVAVASALTAPNDPWDWSKFLNL
jgi:hypothetical protein